MNNQQGFIKYFVIIIVILAIVFLSQQAYSRGVGKNLISDASKQAQAYVAKGSSWAMSAIYPKINDQVQSGGAAISNAVNQEKNKVSENISQGIGKKIENYFSGIANSVLGKENNNCAVQPAQTPAVK